MTRTEAYPNHQVAQVRSLQISDGGAAPGVTISDTAVPCRGCKQRTKIRVDRVPGHWGCLSRLAPVTEPQPERDASPDEKSMFRLLQDSISASRKRPVLRISTADRDLEPWALITEPMRGEHRYRLDAPAGRTVKAFDRNGSYPSAMANVPTSAGPLRRTGSVGYASGHAGIYLIPRFEWTGPHPLGEIAEQDSDLWWISTPHLRLCMSLAARKRITPPRIVDSWTGNSVTNLFKEFSARVSELRELARPNEDAYGEIKRKSSIAIRALWPKGARSPFWRPDWSVSVRAEASVRHWVRADQAIEGGAELVRLGNVDEVAFLVPPKSPR
jgi:hypothetical protein